MSFTYTYPRPALTTDIVVLRRLGSAVEILLIQRKFSPFEGWWSFPGGFVNMDESLDEGAHRELFEETGLSGMSLKQFKAYGDPGRDPRHRTVTIVFYGWLTESLLARASDDAADARWFPIGQLPPLAFDHSTILDELLSNLHLK